MEWIAFDRLEPYEPEVLYMLLGKLVCDVHNALRGKGEPALRMNKLMPWIKGAPEPQTPEFHKAFFKKLAQEMGAKVK